jgi:hypothetical protein
MSEYRGMADSKDAWERAGESFERLGAQLREHYRRAGEDHGGAGEVDDALRRLGDALDAAVKAVGETVRDPEFQETARGAAKALGEALTATFEQVGAQVRGRWERRGEEERSGPS